MEMYRTLQKKVAYCTNWINEKPQYIFLFLRSSILVQHNISSYVLDYSFDNKAEINYFFVVFLFLFFYIIFIFFSNFFFFKKDFEFFFFNCYFSYFSGTVYIINIFTSKNIFWSNYNSIFEFQTQLYILLCFAFIFISNSQVKRILLWKSTYFYWAKYASTSISWWPVRMLLNPDVIN